MPYPTSTISVPFYQQPNLSTSVPSLFSPKRYLPKSSYRYVLTRPLELLGAKKFDSQNETPREIPHSKPIWLSAGLAWWTITYAALEYGLLKGDLNEGVEKRPSMVKANALLNPWVDISRAWMRKPHVQALRKSARDRE